MPSFLVAKTDCTLGYAVLAATIRVHPPNGTRQLFGLAFPTVGASTIGYCKGGAKDLGKLVEISPVAVTERATVTTK